MTKHLALTAIGITLLMLSLVVIANASLHDYCTGYVSELMHGGIDG